MLFKEIIGQAIVKQKLIQTVKENRVSHAQLFFGPEGSGNLALAIAYAQYINCGNKSEDDSCGTCPSCVKYQKLIHPDLHFIYPIATTKSVTKKPLSKNFLNDWREILLNNYYINLYDWLEHIGIENKQGIINAEDCNEVIKTLSLKSYESEYKVMIIWMVEKLFHSAAPKLLKILEEPPDKTLFLLVSENSDLILKTIISRTQLVKIPPITDTDLYYALVEKNNCNPSKARQITNIVYGNYKEAIKQIVEKDDEKYNFNYFSQWMRLCYKYSITEMFSWVDEISKIGRENQKHFFIYALRIVRECLLVNFKTTSMVKLDGQEAEFVSKFSPFINTSNCLDISERLNEALYHIERNANPKILFLDLSLKMAKLLKMKSIP